MHVVTVHVRQIYGSFYEKFDACANSVYQALSPPLKGPGDEANPKHDFVLLVVSQQLWERSCKTTNEFTWLAD